MAPTLQQIVRTSQILVAALLLGVVAFTIVAALVGPVNPPPVAGAPAGTPPTAAGRAVVSTPFGQFDPLLLTLFGLMLAQIPALVVLGVTFGKQAAKLAAADAGDPARRDLSLARAWTSATITRAALGEGAGLFGAVILLLSGERLALIGVAYAALILLAVFPTRGRLENWIDRAVRAANSSAHGSVGR